jgi:glycosyltransferase involved in cell wall biosynthesis
VPPGPKILLIASWYPSASDPVSGIFVEEQAVALSSHHEVAVIVPRLKRWREGVARRPAIERETRRGILVVRTDAIPPVPKWPSATYAGVRLAVRRAYRELAGDWGSPELVHAHVVRHAGWAALSLADELGVPAVLTEHSGPFDVHLRTKLDRAKVEESLANFDAVIAVSPALRAQIQVLVPVPIDVVGNVVDTDFFTPGPEIPSADGPIRVLTASTLTPIKRVDVVLAAVADVARTATQRVELTVVGDGPERDSLEARAIDLALGNSVRFLGAADRETMRHEMRRADVLALASEAETFGIVAAEAMACGTPVIVTLNGGSQYVVPEGLGIHIPVGNAAAAAAAIRAVIDRTADIDLERARESIVQRFSRPAVHADLDRIYERIMQERPGAREPPRSRAHPVS